MIQRIARTGTFGALLTLSIVISPATLADFPTISGSTPQSSDRWTVSGGLTSFSLDNGVLDELDLSVVGPANANPNELPGNIGFPIDGVEELSIWAPWASFDGYRAGSLRVEGKLTLSSPHSTIEVDGFQIQPADNERLQIVDLAGNPLFLLRNIHVLLKPDQHEITLRNMGLAFTPWLAQKLGYPDLSDFSIGTAYVHASLDYPFGAQTEGSCGPVNWHNGNEYLTDVRLNNIGNVQTKAREVGVRVAIAPSATLQNVGTADVPWYRKFTTTSGGTYPQPYNRDQHPFLVWAMYRIVDDIPQQIGQSAIKHAFFTVNGTCGCPGGSILYSAGSSQTGQGCTDTYSDGNNDSPSALGIRDEVPAFTGEWEQCGSMFAPGATAPGPCNSSYSGDTTDEFERRMVVDENELSTPDAQYFMEAWYVIRDDINIFNTMGSRPVTPTLGSTWTFPAGTFSEGPAINSWVAPNTRGANEAHDVQLTNDGHFSVAVKVTDLGENQYRYVYAVMNYDFDPRINKFEMDLPAGVVISNFQYLDGDKVGGNDWTHSTADGKLTFSAPAGGALEWGHMNTFVFEANAAPDAGDTRIEGFEKPAMGSAAVLTPGGLEDLFKSGFEP